MKQLNITLTVEKTEDLKKLLILLAMRIYLIDYGVDSTCFATKHGMINYNVYDSEKRNMMNITLIED
jgi:hypothetical protein